MTDVAVSDLSLKETLKRIDRTQAETVKLSEETLKFVAEQHKLLAEEVNLLRDHGMAPWTITIAVLTSAISMVMATVSLLKSMGVL